LNYSHKESGTSFSLCYHIPSPLWLIALFFLWLNRSIIPHSILGLPDLEIGKKEIGDRTEGNL
jgi:hypothetical protein